VKQIIQSYKSAEHWLAEVAACESGGVLVHVGQHYDKKMSRLFQSHDERNPRKKTEAQHAASPHLKHKT